MPVATLLHGGPISDAVSDAVKRIESERVVERIKQRDYTVWRPSPDEISNRLRWLDCPDAMPDQVESMQQILQAARRDGEN